MIDFSRTTSILEKFYPKIEMVSEKVFRAYDRHNEDAYAVRYFDLNDTLVSTAERLRDYQDNLLGTLYFDPKAGNDLRWNHYLYFITSIEHTHHSDFRRAKAAIESNHEYARKKVVLEDELERILKPHVSHSLAPQQLPPDLLSTWMNILNENGLGFVLDDTIQVPEVSRRVVEGKLHRLRKPLTVSDLDPAELEVSRDIISKLTIKGFRNHPIQREFNFSEVNLIVGANAVGKTSLLETIEYLYCGKTKRSGKLLRGTVVSALLQGTGLSLETSPSTELKKLRARHLNWYGKTELKAPNIDETFGKFNFLDTDAAVGLTVEMSKDRISQDVAQLLLGAQAGKALDRLNRAHRELSATSKSIDKDIKVIQVQRDETKARVDALLNAPRESDQLFSELLIALDRLEWVERPQIKTNSDTLSMSLQVAMTEAQTLGKLDLSSTVLTEPVLVSACRSFEEAIDSSAGLVKREIEAREQKIQIERQLTPLLDHIAAIEALRPFVTSDLETHLQRRNALSVSIGALTSALASAKAAESFSPDKELRQERVSVAVLLSRSRLVELRTQVTNAKRVLEDYERTQADIIALRQQLRCIAQNILPQTPNPDDCPLCHTVFERGKLMEKIFSDVDSIEETMSSSLREKLLSSEKAVTKALSQTAALEGLEMFVGHDLAKSITVANALKDMIKARKQLDAEQDELKTLDDMLQDLAKSGFTSSRLNELKAKAQIQNALPPLLGLDSLKGTLLNKVGLQRQQMASIEEELHKLADDSEILARVHGIDVPVSVEALSRQLAAKLTVHERALKALQKLATLMRMSSTVDPTILSIQIDQTQSLLVQLTTSIARDSMVDAQTTESLTILKKHMKDLEELALQKQRIENAQIILSDLLGKYSEQALSEQILRENGGEIASTFACIHVPGEFDLRTDAKGLRIVRRETEQEVELHEMSTGQRAAYALSLFLAMNSRLQHGPKVLLFDDPIAHVDDINVLSFLDHLRELALKGTRQIFFATANTQIAGLFRHKFRFLGEERFKEIHLTRQ